jgi:hypothetical protein
MDDDDMGGWAQQELLLREQWEAEQELLKADPAYDEWLQQLENDDEHRSA